MSKPRAELTAATPTSYLAERPSILTVGAVSGALAVALGAFGAHALEGSLDAQRLEVYQTANRYHFIHVLALLFVASLRYDQVGNGKRELIKYSTSAFGWGQLVFSGSLYLLATRKLIGLEKASWLGAITPIGGLFFIAGWGLLAFAARGRRSS